MSINDNLHDKINTKMHTEVPLVIAFTPNYFLPAATCLYSIVEHSTSQDHYHVNCLLTEDLSQDLINRLYLIDEKSRLRFSFIKVDEKQFADAYVDLRYTIAASFRLLIPELLPQYDKVIYLDCDIIVRNNLATLYHSTDLGSYYLGAIYEAALDHQVEGLKKQGFEPGWYFNSGFLFLNLTVLRQLGMTHKFLQALQTDYLEFPDQDVLNLCCERNVLALPPYYNSIRTCYLPQYKEAFLKRYTLEDWKAVQQHGNIHYTGGKPWQMYTVEFREWWERYMELPQCVKVNEPIKRQLLWLYYAYKFAPSRCFIQVLQRLYRKIKP